jgi:hypothetical protein
MNILNERKVLIGILCALVVLFEEDFKSFREIPGLVKGQHTQVSFLLQASIKSSTISQPSVDTLVALLGLN